ncbi:hypothetical protein BRADI_2g47900v3 [Brachypodium distachyon]|uniref:Bowman-Birk serine protease inhibitors family domain-containing protein n=1 Tax=Brachypodium distachyon TaxID=15368 RepID=I1HQU9_BRADI|nr:hypothetical protein BRADI_2g47900v3 [Brachypodium distachyon]
MAPATRISTAAVAMAVVITMILAAAVERAEAGQNCMCECVKLCMRTHIPAMDGCKGKCRENSCIESCSTACVKKGFPKPPNEGIPTCEIEPLSADEQQMLGH